jgi:hypothetical protein
MLCAWGITTDGKPVFLALAPISAERHDAVVDFLRDLTERGLRAPLLVVTDGAPGLVSALEQVFGESLRQRCLVHRARNLLAKVSKGDQERSRPTSGRSSMTSSSSPAMPPSKRHVGARTRSPTSGEVPIPARSRASPATSPRS